ncbi:MAG: rRNA maturation RNase YbeY [Pseudomonadota bacterium]|nr:rRNA maturation RNase YbeY [Pseudomonadota bacterium]
MDNGANRLTVCISDNEARWHDLQFDVPMCCEAALRASFEAAGGREVSGEVSILLSSDTWVAQLNQKYRGVEGPTNVLSFPAVSGSPHFDVEMPVLLGDIVVAFETLVQEAEAARIAVHAHLAHMVVHGALHLLGFDHQFEEEAEVMEKLEIQSLKSLGIGSPYLEHS